MTYLEYQEYLNIGGVCDVTTFNRNIDRACSIIDGYTYNRIENMKSIPREAKALCRDLIEYFATNANYTENNVSSWSQSAGNVNESVTYAQTSVDDMPKSVANLVFDYLWSVVDDNATPVLYRGARS